MLTKHGRNLTKLSPVSCAAQLSACAGAAVPRHTCRPVPLPARLAPSRDRKRARAAATGTRQTCLCRRGRGRLTESRFAQRWSSQVQLLVEVTWPPLLHIAFREMPWWRTGVKKTQQKQITPCIIIKRTKLHGTDNHVLAWAEESCQTI